MSEEWGKELNNAQVQWHTLEGKPVRSPAWGGRKGDNTGLIQALMNPYLKPRSRWYRFRAAIVRVVARTLRVGLIEAGKRW